MIFKSDFFLIKFHINDFYKTALYIAVDKGWPEIVQLLLSCENIDVNIKCISNYFIF